MEMEDRQRRNNSITGAPEEAKQNSETKLTYNYFLRKHCRNKRPYFTY